MMRPLEGLTVLAAEQMHSLPHATQLLALMGAEVIKVEPLTGEAGRSGRPTITDLDGRASEAPNDGGHRRGADPRAAGLGLTDPAFPRANQESRVGYFHE